MLCCSERLDTIEKVPWQRRCGDYDKSKRFAEKLFIASLEIANFEVSDVQAGIKVPMDNESFSENNHSKPKITSIALAQPLLNSPDSLLIKALYEIHNHSHLHNSTTSFPCTS